MRSDRYFAEWLAQQAAVGYDVIWFFDCLHDFGDPIAIAGRARDQLAEQGTIALVEPFAHDELAENLAANPGAGPHYAASTFLCVPHLLSQPGRAALGAQAGGRRLPRSAPAAARRAVTRTPRATPALAEPRGRCG